MLTELRIPASISAAAWSGVVAGGLLVAGCGSGTAATPEPTPLPEPIALTVLHTNDNWGETKPCG